MRSGRTKSEAGLLVLLVFVLGMLVGGVGYHLWDGRVSGSSNPYSGPGHPPPPRQTLAQQLQLTPDQQKQLDAIRDDARPQFQAVDAERSTIMLQTRDKIRAILTPEQLTKFNAMIKDMDGRGRGGNRGGGPSMSPGQGPRPDGPQGRHPGPGF